MKLFTSILVVASMVAQAAPNPHTQVQSKNKKDNCEVLLRDYSQSKNFKVSQIITPKTLSELIQIIKTTKGPISVLGGGFSMGGQVTNTNGVVIDMSEINKIEQLDPEAKTITVQAGATWRQIQKAIFRHGLAVKVMQSYNNFQVGGALSVNVHGRYVGYGPIISSVQSIKVLLASGKVITASRTKNSDLFFGAIGGYGSLGIIVSATLDLADDVNIEREYVDFSQDSLAQSAESYEKYFHDKVEHSEDAVMTNADIYPPDYKTIRSVTYRKTTKKLTEMAHMQENTPPSFLRSLLVSVEQLITKAKRYREHTYDPYTLKQSRVVTRNFEASYDVSELTPLNERYPILKKFLPFSDRRGLLQEYFIPEGRLAEFLPIMKDVFLKHGVNVSNVSIRHVPKNTESTLSWAKEDSFALVIFYSQPYGGSEKAKAVELEKAKTWTQEMLDQVLAVGGSYYLPYQRYARTDQFRQAYPQHQELLNIKAKYDPSGKFQNNLIRDYFMAEETYHYAEMMKSQQERIDMVDFFKNVFSIYPSDKIMAAVEQAYAQVIEAKIDPNDRNIYTALQKTLAQNDPGALTRNLRGVRSLRIQQAEMTAQTKELLAPLGKRKFNGYMEIGTAGRYVNYLKAIGGQSQVVGKSYVVNDVRPGFLNPADLMERTGGYGALDPRSYFPAVAPSRFVDLADYDMIAESEVYQESVDLASMFIGLHHIPPQKLRSFLASIHRSLRPGGIFILRDHDVTNERLGRMATLAHSTFNAGLGISYEAEINEVRNFQSVDYWQEVLASVGFRLVSAKKLQEGDPTANTLMLFEKIASPANPIAESKIQVPRNEQEAIALLNAHPDYFRSGTHTYMVAPEWIWVDIYKEFGDLQARYPWFRFPFEKYLELAKQSVEANVRYAQRQGVDDRAAFNRYKLMDDQLNSANGLLFKILGWAAKFTIWSLRNDRPPVVTGFVVAGATDQMLSGLPEGMLKSVTKINDDLHVMYTQRQLPFTRALEILAQHDGLIVKNVAGHTDISVLFSSKNGDLSRYQSKIRSLDIIHSYQFPTPVSVESENLHMHTVKIAVEDLTAMIRLIKQQGDTLKRVHDF